MEKHTAEFEFRAHPDHPGWNSWKLPDETRVNAAVMGQPFRDNASDAGAEPES